MPPTSEEIRAQLRAERRSASPNASPGARFRGSDLARRLASGKGLEGGHHRVEVTEDPWQFRDYLRARAFDMSALELMTDAERIVQVRPTPVSLLPLVTIVPTSTVQIPTIPESLQVEDASYTPDAQNLPGLGPDVDGSNIAGWSVDYLEAVRVGRIIPVPLAILEDAGQAEATIDRLISQNWARAIEGYLVAGNVTNLVGITQTAGVQGFTVGSPLSEFDSLAAGVAAVMSGGFYGPHVVAASPNTLKDLFTLRDNFGNYLRWRSAL
ncbi:MAG TPA: phage major capsid protein, partial [Acidimicrobiales bacterium]|nr:phage major capsid protein [Acidimicrobiales bacterium]